MNLMQEKYTESTENWIRTITVSWIDFIDTKLVTSAIWNIERFLKWKRECEIYKLDESRTLHQFSWNYYIIEYSDKDIRDKDRELFKSNFKPTKFFAEQEGDWNQVPECDLKVDYDWKYYTLVYAHLKLTEDEDKGKWVYKWVIFNPQKYFEVQQGKDDTNLKIDNILEWKD